MTAYIFEGGTNTENRVGCVTFALPQSTSRPPMHWHRFHDEVFFITRGTVRFTTPDGDIDATEGNVMIVPPKAIHTFSNPSDTEDAEIYMTSTPGYYIDYFRMLSKSGIEEKRLTAAETQHLMALFGTFPPEVESEP